MATTTNFGWVTPDNTDLVKDGAAAIRTLGSSIDSTMGELKGGTTGQVLSKTTGTDMDFTWVTTDDTNAIQNAIVDAKGDLIGATAADTPARLAVGANDTMLIADSTAATGLAWKTATTQFPWTAWTPTYQNFTLGNGTVIARYQQIGKTVNFWFSLILGTTSSITGALGFSLPASNKQNDIWMRNCVLQDVGVGAYAGAGILFDGVCYLRAEPSNIAYLFYTPISATIPFTWVSTDFITIAGTYEVA